jgi:hypothetical protein
MNWGAFDLNLLIVFDAVMQERNVTRAGQKVGLSQPAMSHALNRLRYMLKDELFVRRPDGMMPTARAEQLAAPLRRAFSDMQTIQASLRAAVRHRNVGSRHLPRSQCQLLGRRGTVVHRNDAGVVNLRIDRLDPRNCSAMAANITTGLLRAALLVGKHHAVAERNHDLAYHAALMLDVAQLCAHSGSLCDATQRSRSVAKNRIRPGCCRRRTLT